MKQILRLVIYRNCKQIRTSLCFKICLLINCKKKTLSVKVLNSSSLNIYGTSSTGHQTETAFHSKCSCHLLIPQSRKKMGRNARLCAGGIASKTVSFGFLYMKLGNVRSQSPLLTPSYYCEITVYPWFVESIFIFKLYMKIPAIHNNYFVFVMNHCLTLNILTCKAKITSPIFFRYHSALYRIWTFQFLSRKVL